MHCGEVFVPAHSSSIAVFLSLAEPIILNNSLKPQHEPQSSLLQMDIHMPFPYSTEIYFKCRYKCPEICKDIENDH